MTPPPASLERRLGPGAAVAFVVGEIVGVGIFLTPAEMAKALGSPLRVLLVWLAVGLTAFCGALCYGELAARWPEAGGGYVYLREAYGPGLAFLYGWKSLLVMDPGLTAALAAGVTQYVAYVVPLPPAGATALAMGVIAALALVNALGVRAGARVLGALTVLKLVLLAAIVVLGLASAEGRWSNFVPLAEPRPGSAPLVAGLAGGIVAAFFSFGGFWDVAKLAGEMRDPARTMPRALATGVAAVTVLYLLTSAVFIYLVPIENASSGAAFAARAGEAVFGRAGGSVFAAVVALAVLGSLSAFVMAAPRVYYAMARDGLFPRALGEAHPRFHTPVRAIALQAVLACLLLGLGTFSQIVAYFVFVTVAFVALTVAGLYRLPRPAAGAYRIPGYPVTPLGFLALLVTLLVLLGAGSPRQAALGTLVVALGGPVYHFLVAPRRHLPAIGDAVEEA